jgi:BCD family chlorophyll transporter-like MFS transporter
MNNKSLGWLGIARLGLVQTSLGSIVVLTTTTINRVMVVELSMMAIIPGLLVAWHYALQVLRPRWGHGSDNGGKRTPWIIGGMATLAAGGLLAAASVWLASTLFWAGLALAAIAFTLIGIGVGAAGTSLLVLLAETVNPERRGAAATVLWTMMIGGFILTTVLAGKFLDPFSMQRLVVIAAIVVGTAFVISTAAVWGIEAKYAKRQAPKAESEKVDFGRALRDVWADLDARRFAIFVFISMVAYSAQELIIDPFAGFIFGYTPGQSTSLSGAQHSGALLGMIFVGVASSFAGKAKALALRNWTVFGCIASALALTGLVGAAVVGAAWPLKPNVFALGFANGMFAVAAIGSMFSAAAGQTSREGIRMGLFGASQAIAFAAGGFLGTITADILKFITQSSAASYGTVFGLEAALFIISAVLALRIGAAPRAAVQRPMLTPQHEMA